MDNHNFLDDVETRKTCCSMLYNLVSFLIEDLISMEE
jgi:hypothetical protein